MLVGSCPSEWRQINYSQLVTHFCCTVNFKVTTSLYDCSHHRSRQKFPIVNQTNLTLAVTWHPLCWPPSLPTPPRQVFTHARVENQACNSTSASHTPSPFSIVFFREWITHFQMSHELVARVWVTKHHVKHTALGELHSTSSPQNLNSVLEQFVT